MLTIVSGAPNTFKSVMARSAMAMNLRHGARGLYVDIEGLALDWHREEMTAGDADRAARLTTLSFPGAVQAQTVMDAVTKSAEEGVKLVVIDPLNHIFVGPALRSGFYSRGVLTDFIQGLEDHARKFPQQRIIAIVTTNRSGAARLG